MSLPTYLSFIGVLKFLKLCPPACRNYCVIVSVMILGSCFDTHHIGLVLVFVYSDDTAPSQAFANNGAPTNSTAHNSDKCNPTKSSIPILLSLFSPSVSS